MVPPPILSTSASIIYHLVSSRKAPLSLHSTAFSTIPLVKTMSSVAKTTQSSVPEGNGTQSSFPAQAPLLSHASITANGEQDQGVSFEGPNSSEADDSAISNSPDLTSAEFPKSSMGSALRRDSFKNIGQRRRSSSSNQPNVNLRRGTFSHT